MKKGVFMKKTFLKMLLCASIFSISNASASTVKDLYFDSCTTVQQAINSGPTAYQVVGTGVANLLLSNEDCKSDLASQLKECAKKPGLSETQKKNVDSVIKQITDQTVQYVKTALKKTVPSLASEQDEAVKFFTDNPDVALKTEAEMYKWIKAQGVGDGSPFKLFKEAKHTRKDLAATIANLVANGKVQGAPVSDLLKILASASDKQNTLQVPESRSATPSPVVSRTASPAPSNSSGKSPALKTKTPGCLSILKKGNKTSDDAYGAK